MNGLESHYFDCSCMSLEHTLRFVFDTEDHFLYAEVYLNRSHGFFGRVWRAIKYVFGYKSKYGEFGEWILDERDCDRLIALLRRVKEVKGTIQ